MKMEDSGLSDMSFEDIRKENVCLKKRLQLLETEVSLNGQVIRQLVKYQSTMSFLQEECGHGHFKCKINHSRYNYVNSDGGTKVKSIPGDLILTSLPGDKILTSKKIENVANDSFISRCLRVCNEQQLFYGSSPNHVGIDEKMFVPPDEFKSIWENVECFSQDIPYIRFILKKKKRPNCYPGTYADQVKENETVVSSRQHFIQPKSKRSKIIWLDNPLTERTGKRYQSLPNVADLKEINCQGCFEYSDSEGYQDIVNNPDHFYFNDAMADLEAKVKLRDIIENPDDYYWDPKGDIEAVKVEDKLMDFLENPNDYYFDSDHDEMLRMEAVRQDEFLNDSCNYTEDGYDDSEFSDDDVSQPADDNIPESTDGNPNFSRNGESVPFEVPDPFAFGRYHYTAPGNDQPKFVVESEDEWRLACNHDGRYWCECIAAEGETEPPEDDYYEDDDDDDYSYDDDDPANYW